jgi:hypothetical protein
MDDLDGHATCVEEWLGRSSPDHSSAALVAHFETALHALWVRAETPLGAVTLTAIADRVLSLATEKFPLLAGLEIEAPGGIHCRALREQAGSIDPSVLRAAIHHVLVALLTVIGTLTAEILTPALHAELSRPAAEPSASEREVMKP